MPDESTPNVEEVTEPTKDELYERAQELDIEGRSSMSKDELAEAIAAAESASQIEGAVTPPFLKVSFASGQEALIPVDFGCILQVLGGDANVQATVALQGVTGLELVF